MQFFKKQIWAVKEYGWRWQQKNAVNIEQKVGGEKTECLSLKQTSAWLSLFNKWLSVMLTPV